MDWTMVGAIGELVGALVVAVSLVYLTTQLRMTNKIAKAEAWRAMAHKAADNVAAGTFDPTFRAVFVKVWVENATAEALTRDERVLLGLWLTTHLNVLEQVHREVEVGLLPREALSDWGQGLYSKPYFRQAWAKTLRHNHSKAFQAYMERVYDLSDPGLDSDHRDPTFGLGLEERARSGE